MLGRGLRSAGGGGNDGPPRIDGDLFRRPSVDLSLCGPSSQQALGLQLTRLALCLQSEAPSWHPQQHEVGGCVCMQSAVRAYDVHNYLSLSVSLSLSLCFSFFLSLSLSLSLSRLCV